MMLPMKHEHRTLCVCVSLCFLIACNHPVSRRGWEASQTSLARGWADFPPQ